MPRQGKQKKDDTSNEAYQALLNERVALLKQRKKCIGNRTFSELTETDQLYYCSLNQRLMNNYWNGFETVKAHKKFKRAARDFQRAREMDSSKAHVLFSEQRPDETLQHEKPVSTRPEENFITGICFHLGLGVPQNQSEAARFYTAAAKQGHAQAQYNLGYNHINGVGVGRSKRQAVHWYRLAAEQDHASAQVHLGNFYLKGIGVKINRKEAFRWYKLAAEQGHARAQYNLGLCYQKGTGVKVNTKEAFRWFHLAAEQGYTRAQVNLGHFYQKGIDDVKENPEEAFRWFHLAVKQGDNNAQYHLGYCYHKGLGVKEDNEEAARWFHLAAEQGHTRAQCILGYFYGKGIGVDENEEEAVRWYRLAAEQGDARALYDLKNIATLAASYTVAFLEKKHDEVIKLVLQDAKLEATFFTKDIITIAKQLKNEKNAISFLQALEIEAKKLNRNISPSLIDVLLILNKTINENDHKITVFMGSLIHVANFADAQTSQVKELMHFFCNLYDENRPEDILKPLITLWYRAQALELPMENSGLNQLIAAKLVSHLFQKTHYLKFIADFNQSDLAVIIFAFERIPKFTVEQLNHMLSEPLLVHSKYHPKNLLPRLKACLSNDDFFEKRTRYIDKLNKALQSVNLEDAQKCQTVFDDLTKYAKGLMSKKSPSLFNNNEQKLTKEEAQLLHALSEQNRNNILGWIEAYESKIEQNANTSTALEMSTVPKLHNIDIKI